jgi:hypothetical protein
VSTADRTLLEANWTRVRIAIDNTAREYERTAEELRSIPFDNSKGFRRAPEAIISQAALTADSGRTHADLMHRLATWAEAINEILRHQAAAPEGTVSSRTLCPHRIPDPDAPDRSCVLSAGHSLPTADGLTVHVDEDGVMFA